MQLFRALGIIVMQCGPIDLVAGIPRQLNDTQIGYGALPDHEDMMTWKFPAASKLAVLLAAAAVVATGLAPASAQSPKPKHPPQQQYDTRRPSRVTARAVPIVVYQQGPHTRVYVTTRSWLDAGVEVLPGDRKFQDYAFPPDVGYPSFARENNNRPIDRPPLNPPSDMGGYDRTFPLY